MKHSVYTHTYIYSQIYSPTISGLRVRFNVIYSLLLLLYTDSRSSSFISDW